MAFSTDVATFTQILGPFYEYVADLRPITEGEEGKEVKNDRDNDNSVSDSEVDETPSKYEGKPNLKQLLGQYEGDDDDDLDEAHTSLDESVKSIQDELLEAKKVVDDFRNSFNESTMTRREEGNNPREVQSVAKTRPNEVVPLLSDRGEKEFVQDKISRTEQQHQQEMPIRQVEISKEEEEEDIFEDTIGPEYFVVGKNKYFSSCYLIMI